ncbi:MAG: glycosyltransferase [Pseudomonadota bacterium]
MMTRRILPASFHIAAYSDLDPLPERRPLWGDYWLKENLRHEIRDLHFSVLDSDSAVLIHLFGKPLESLPEDSYKILWNHSHPDWVTPEVLSKYDKIYCISKPFIARIEQMGFEAEWLMAPTSAQPVDSPKAFDLVFVGNARRDGTERAIEWLSGAPYHIGVWGLGWEGRIPATWIRGKFFENKALGKLYSSAKIVINDHHEDMRREGFINPRILDAMASGSLVISDYTTSMEEVFEDAVPVFNTRGELHSLVERYLADDSERERLAVKGRQIARKFSYAAAAARIVEHVKSTLC